MAQELQAIAQAVWELRGIVGQMSQRLSSLEERLNHLEERLDRLGAEVRSNFRWTIGVIVTMWVTIILAIILRGAP